MASAKREELLPDDALLLKNMVGKTATIETVNEVIHTGVIYVIDPLYKTVVLLTTKLMTILPYHGIKTFDVCDVALDETVGTFSETKLCDTAADTEKKERLKRWLQHMYIDVEECEDSLKVGDHLTIIAPYDKNSCMCNNTVVLDKIRNIIDYMPESFR